EDGAGTRLRLARSACDDEGGELIVSLDDDAQSIGLGDLEPAARLRTLAITTSDRVLAFFARASPAPPTAAAAPSPSPIAASAAAALGVPPREAEPVPEPEDPAPPRAPSLELRLGAGGLVLVTARSLDLFG